jgi:hypothetical protein
LGPQKPWSHLFIVHKGKWRLREDRDLLVSHGSQKPATAQGFCCDTSGTVP